MPLFGPKNKDKVGPIFLLLLNFEKSHQNFIIDSINEAVRDQAENPLDASIITKNRVSEANMESGFCQIKVTGFEVNDVIMFEEEEKKDDRIMVTNIASKDLTIVNIDSDELMAYICHYLKSKGENASKKKATKSKLNV